MAKVEIYELDNGGKLGMIWCKYCNSYHGYYLDKPSSNGSIWTFNNDLEKPTFNPSMLYRREFINDKPLYICHSFVKDGFIQYLNDCTHELAGKTVELENV